MSSIDLTGKHSQLSRHQLASIDSTLLSLSLAASVHFYCLRALEMSSEISSSFYGRLDPPVPEVWPFPIPPSPTIAAWTGDREAELILSEQRGRKKRRVSAAPTMSEDESSKLASTSSGNDPTVCEVKRLRSSRNLKAEAEASSGVCNKPIKKNAQPSEAPKPDFIHVRARRGQATDNHSLAERARREKISERMKTLQGLVPGCNKVIGKASVLDEIINYIQALQNQIEFLSMKLETVNSLMDIGIEGFPPKDRGPEDSYGNLNFTTMMLQHPSPSEEREPESLVQIYDSLLVSHSAHDQH